MKSIYNLIYPISEIDFVEIVASCQISISNSSQKLTIHILSSHTYVHFTISKCSLLPAITGIMVPTGLDP